MGHALTHIASQKAASPWTFGDSTILGTPKTRITVPAQYSLGTSLLVAVISKRYNLAEGDALQASGLHFPIFTDATVNLEPVKTTMNHRCLKSKKRHRYSSLRRVARVRLRYEILEDRRMLAELSPNDLNSVHLFEVSDQVGFADSANFETATTLDKLAETSLPDGGFNLAVTPEKQGKKNSLVISPRDSNPSAAWEIFLDFNGNTLANDWVCGSRYRNVVTPVFDLDGDRTTFTDYELEAIHEVWARVSEDYTPFNVNVRVGGDTAHSPDRLIRVLIGGSDDDWYKPKGGAGGVACIGSAGDQTRPAFVFPGTTISYIADSVSHEAGHTLGLEHQSEFDSSNPPKLIGRGYRSGDDFIGPIMGSTTNYPIRTIWSTGYNPG